jgi:hypothetical protein
MPPFPVKCALAICSAIYVLSCIAALSGTTPLHINALFPMDLKGLCYAASPNSTYPQMYYEGTCLPHPNALEATELQWKEYYALGAPAKDCYTTPIRNPMCITPVGEIFVVQRPCPQSR